MVLKLPQYDTTMQGIINGIVNHFGLKQVLQEVVSVMCSLPLPDVKN